MTLPEGFRFSQASLQDFADCRRRFQLRYLERLSWPALESEPALANEALIQAGQQFHMLVHQHQVGIDAERIQSAIRDPELLGWWQNYLDHPPADLPEVRFPEHVLSVPLEGHRLVARFDLLAVTPGERLVIVDWKTSQKPPGRRWLADRLQTLVYRYVAVEAGAYLNNGGPFEPEQVSLVYWFAADPGASVVFSYSAGEHAAAAAALREQVGEIEALVDDQFTLTDDVARCRFCPYRSLCDRGVRAGVSSPPDVEAREDPGSFDLDLEQVIEIAF